MTPQITTPRLILRPPIESDFETFAKAQADPEFKKHTGGTIDRAAAFNEFIEWQKFWEKNNYCFFSVIEKESNEWIGRVGPTKRASFEFQEIGWSIVPNFQGRGYAYEATCAALEWVTKNLNWNNAIFRIGAENKMSQALAIKLGAKNHGLEIPPKSEGKDIEVWKR